MTTNDVDVLGTRLHGGIRGLRHGGSVLITAIDDQARNIGQEIALPTILRNLTGDELVARLLKEFPTALSLPESKITQFLGQCDSLR